MNEKFFDLLSLMNGGALLEYSIQFSDAAFSTNHLK